MTALALSGCMHPGAPVAAAQPHSDLDYMAYGQPAPASAVANSTASGDAVGALRASFASTSRRPYYQATAAYAAAPAPVRYDAAYHLDAGDKLRVVVFGQEGLTNTYALDAAG